MANKCKECGCACKKCISGDQDVHLHVEIENLKQKLLERENHIVTMETNFLNEANKFPSGEFVALREELLTWQDKYKRLYEAHRRVQRVNQGLEDKLLKLVDVCETDKNTLTKDIATLSQKLAEANYAIKKLTEDNERYKKDVSLAIEFLQCKQSHFVAHRYDSLPQEVQLQVSSYMTGKKKPEERRVYEPKSIKVPIPTFPPTAMFYSLPKSPKPDHQKPEIEPDVDIVSAAIMAKVLEERQKEKACAKHCDTCTCSSKLKIIYDTKYHNIGTQTSDLKNNICLKCCDNSLLSQMNKNCEKVSIFGIDESAQIVKVQPNNFLIKAEKSSPTNSNSHLRNNEIEIPKAIEISEHHYLCNNRNSPTQSNQSAKHSTSDPTKTPRFCSMRLQFGSRNILLDNIQNNVAPVLYTSRQKSKDTTSNSSDDCRTRSNYEGNEQRVADWIQNNLDNDLSSSDNSRCDSSAKYAEMEENVKRFLFGESDFLKTVELGRTKYKNYDNHVQGNNNDDSSSKSD